jgi:hypothetical protein
MSDEITSIVPRTIDETKALSKDLAASQLIPQALKKRPEDIMAIVLTGAELGLPPLTAIRGIHIINGKPTLSADLMGALVKKSSACEYLTLAESTPKVATYRTKRKGEPGETLMSFTMDQAKTAGLTSNPTWSKYPDAMLRARCLAAICRAVYPDLCLGLYESDSEEITEKDVTPTDMRTHVETVKADLRSHVVEGEVVIELSLKDQIEGVCSLAALDALVPELKKLSVEQRQVLRPVYESKKAELMKGNS